MPRLCVILPLGGNSEWNRTAVRATVDALPADSRLVLLAGPGNDAAHDEDRRVTLERTSEALTAQQAVNWALQHTDSELIARVNPAGATLGSRFRAALGAAATNDVVYAPASVVGAHVRGRSLRAVTGALPLSSDAMRLHLLLSSRVASGTLIGRRTVLVRAGGYRDVPLAEYELALRLAQSRARLHRVAILSSAGENSPSAPAEAARRGETEELVAEAFRDLSTRLLGRAYLRLPVLASLPLSADELEEELASFQADLRRAARRLPMLERSALHQVLRNRICAARELHERLGAPVT